MPRRFGPRRAPGTKHIVDVSNILAATTNTVVVLAHAVENAALASASQIDKGSKITSIYLSLFHLSEDGEAAAQIPLIDWYLIKDDADTMNTAGFVPTGLPTPGATGTHENKRKILHEEKGISGIQNAASSSAGIPMVTKNVFRVPRGMQTFRMGDKLLLVHRSNFLTKFCLKTIYKEYRG